MNKLQMMNQDKFGCIHLQQLAGPEDHQTSSGLQIKKTGTCEIQLRNRAEKPFTPKKLMQTQSVESNETEYLFREVRNILNKLTQQNLQKLTSNLINFPINNEDRLKGTIDIIFKKSIDEQVLTQTYAQLCKVLFSIKVPSNAEPLTNVNFRTMLLTRCQKEFDSYQDIKSDKLIQEVDECVDEQKKGDLKN